MGLIAAALAACGMLAAIGAFAEPAGAPPGERVSPRPARVAARDGGRITASELERLGHTLPAPAARDIEEPGV